MPMRRALIYSILMHFAVAVLAWVGIPAGGPLDVEEVQIIAVELADVSETPVRAAPKPKAQKKAEPEEPPAPPPAPPEEVAAAVPPPPPPPKPVEAEPEPVPVPTPSKEPAPEREAPLLPARPRPKPVRQKPDDFDSVLKTLELLDSEKPPEKKPDKKEESSDLLDDVAALLDSPDTPLEQDAQKAPVLGNRLTISEIDAVRRQIEPCWNVPVGARNPEELIVDLFLRLRPDGSVMSVEVVDKSRMRTDSFFRAAADSARRAVLNERCTPLKLPPDKYDRWREMTLRFDPSRMVGR